MVLSATSRPSRMISTRSAVAAISASTWLDTSTVLPPAARAAQEAAQPVDALRIEAVGGFVQDQHRRVAKQRGCQREPLPHAQREAAHPPIRRPGEGHLGEYLVHPARCTGQPPGTAP